jgi:N-acetylneuraminate synthase/sialic acid synthase
MERRLTIDGCVIDDSSDCYVIAEIGHNHQGSLETAEELVAQAAACGANAVKLQKRSNRTLFTREQFNKPYENRNSFGNTYGEHREFLEFGRDQYLRLMDMAREKGLALFATAFDIESADFLAELDMPAYKIASGDVTNTPLLRHVAALGKPVILSTGGCLLEEVREAYEAMAPLNPNVAILQCTSGYPSAYEELNLRVIKTYRDEFPAAVIGLSAHDSGIAMSLVAYVLGARIVEKHFTLNRAMRGTDHSFSLEPVGLRKMVRDLRRARVALGDGSKGVYDSERGPLSKMTKKMVAVRPLPAGHRLQPDDLAAKCVGSAGIQPNRLQDLLGAALAVAVDEDQPILFEHLKPHRAS